MINNHVNNKVILQAGNEKHYVYMNKYKDMNIVLNNINTRICVTKEIL